MLKFNLMMVLLAGIISLANARNRLETIPATHLSVTGKKEINKVVGSEPNLIKSPNKIYIDEYLITESQYGMN